MIYIKLSNGVEFLLDSVSEVKAENCHIIVSIVSNEKNIYFESKYFFPIKDINIFEIKESFT